jgi:hypothetical protein
MVRLIEPTMSGRLITVRVSMLKYFLDDTYSFQVDVQILLVDRRRRTPVVLDRYLAMLNAGLLEHIVEKGIEGRILSSVNP